MSAKKKTAWQLHKARIAKIRRDTFTKALEIIDANKENWGAAYNDIKREMCELPEKRR